MEKFWIKEIYLPIIHLIIGYIIYKLASKLIRVTLSKKQLHLNKNSYNYKRIETFKNLLLNITKVIIILLTILSILPIFGVDVTSLLAGLGIASAVLALALQDTLKDLIGGITIILENQFALGDTVLIGNFKGEVITMGLKSTRLRNYEGYVKIIANRNITEVVNYSCSYSLAIVDVGVSYNSDIEKIEQILTELAEELSKSLPKLKGPVELLGIQSLDTSSINFRLTAKTDALENYFVEREIRKAIKLRFDEKKIDIPYPQIEVHNGD